MTNLLAITAFFMALGAVFLANDAIRKAESRTEAFIKNHVEKLKADIKQNLNLIDELRDDHTALKKAFGENDADRSKIKGQLEQMDEKLNKVSDDLAALDDAIKPQARKAPRKSA